MWSSIGKITPDEYIIRKENAVQIVVLMFYLIDVVTGNVIGKKNRDIEEVVVSRLISLCRQV